jgi:tetratricopeptide (TPR) repeat protein
MHQAEPLLLQALEALERVGNREQWVRAKAFHGLAVAVMGDYVVGTAEMQGALASAREMGSDPLACIILILLAAVHVYRGNPLQAMEAARESARVAEETGDRLYVYLARGWQACAECRAGQLEAAEASMADSQAIAEELGGRLHFEDYFLATRAEMALGAGRTQEAIDLARQAVATAQGTGGLAGEALARRVWGQALAKLTPPQWDEAEAQFAESVRLIESAPCPSEAARTHIAWGTACREWGDLGAAREHWEQAAGLWEACGITWELEKVHALIATLPEM